MPNIIEGFRLAPQQRQFRSANPEAAHRRAVCALLIEGPSDAARLKDALRECIARHAILRTSYYVQPGLKVPIQVVGDEANFVWFEATLHGDEAAQDVSFEEHWQAELDAPVEAAQDGAIVRAALLNLSANRRFLLVGLPALSADDVTLENLAGEISRLYALSFTNEKPADEPVQFLQFSEWRNELLESEEAAGGAEYWQSRYAPAAGTPSLPQAKQPPAGTDFQPAYQEFSIDEATSMLLEETAAEHGSSVRAVLLACWQTLLYRLTGSHEITVNTHFDGRKFDELRESLGPFAQWLPVRCGVEAGLGFGELLRRVEAELREASERLEFFAPHKDDAAADPGSALNIAFEYRSRPAASYAGGLSFSLYRRHMPGPPFGVKLRCVRRDAALRVEFHYDTNFYDDENIRRIAGYFTTLLDGIAGDWQRPVEEFEILGEAERRRLLEEWNLTASPYPHELCLHELLEAQVESTPDHTAVVCEHERLSFAELNAKANQLARHLQTAGVGPESRVGILMERSSLLVVALLGVLKAGAGYVPLDSEYPVERLSFMLNDSSVSVLLTQKHLSEKLSLTVEREIYLDADWERIAAHEAIDLGRTAAPDNLAYIIYTSGSTGTPKGVMISHRGLVNYVNWAMKAYDADAGRGAPVHSPLGFDLTVTSLFVPLVAGRRAWMLPESQGIAALSNAMRAEGDFSLVKLTPSHLELLAQLLPAEDAQGRTRAFIVGGESLTGEMLGFRLTHDAQTRIVNEYGPTETVVGCCVYEVPQGSTPAGAIPIGKPIANMQMYVLDEHMRPVPAGVAGELYIGGVGVARGYANRPALTGEKFVPQPFGGEPGARMYRTGDVGRHLPDGNIEFLGRRDSQVKVRGFRIELGEIEAVLRGHVGVREAVVSAREDKSGDKRLVAYVVSRTHAAPRSDELRLYLKERLPEHMIPTGFVTLDELPLTHNGKIDRRKLPEPESVRSGPETSYAPPQSELENIIARIWQEVLRVEKVGVNDNFFDLGGHSFLVLEVSRRLMESFGDEVTLMDMFNYPTVTLLAKHLSREGGDAPALQESQSRADTRKSSLRRQRQQRVRNRVTTE